MDDDLLGFSAFVSASPAVRDAVIDCYRIPIPVVGRARPGELNLSRLL